MLHFLRIHFPSGGQQLHIVNELAVLLFGIQKLGNLRIVQVYGVLARLVLAGNAGEEQKLTLLPVVNALKVLAGADGPVHSVGLNAQLPLQLVQQVEGIPGFSVHFVDEGENRNVPHGADLEKLPGLGLYTLSAVDDHDGRVRRHQGTVGVLRKVLVARGIQDVDAEAFILELHHRGRNGNTALLLDLHPVGSGGTGVLLSLDHAGLGNGPAVEQEFFRQSGFTGVGMGNDGKGPAAADFFLQS